MKTPPALSSEKSIDPDPLSGTYASEAGSSGDTQNFFGRRSVQLSAGVLITLLLLAWSLSVGVYDVAGSEDGLHMFLVSRIPRTASLALAGATMALCGLVMQLLTQNKFVEPTTTGTTQWAGLGLILTMVFFPAASLVQKMVGSIIVSFIGTMIFFVFLRRVTLKSSLVVPIVGIMLGAVVNAATTFLALRFDLLQQLGSWFAGSFTNIVRGRYELLWLVLAVCIAIYVVADRFTVAGLGKDIATNVGLNYEHIIIFGVAMVAISSGVISVVIGSLPFLGLIVPNMVSMVGGDDLRKNLPWVCMVGMWILIIGDIIGRSIVAPYEVPVSLILGVLGTMVFIAMLVRIRNRV